MSRSIVAGGADWTVYAEYSRYRAPGAGESLCFESPAIRRRTSPLPAAWENLPEAELVKLWESAAPPPTRATK
jgi:hypothetical protein